LTYLERQTSYGLDKLRWEEAEEAEAEEKNQTKTMSSPGQNIFVFRGRSMIIGMWVHDHQAVCRVP
jgi:hypothetical protein